MHLLASLIPVLQTVNNSPVHAGLNSYCMKKLLLALFSLISIVSFSQTTGYLRYDTVRVQRGGGNSTLVIENATRGLTGGFLQNYSEGRTRFARALDSVWVDGDSLRFRYGTTTIAVLAPGTGGFFGDETGPEAPTTKDANGQDYTLTNAGVFTLGGNTLLFSPVDSLLLENIPVDGAEETEPELTNLIGLTASGKMKRAGSGFGKFGLEDNLATEDRAFNFDDYKMTMIGTDGSSVSGIEIDKHGLKAEATYTTAKTSLEVLYGEVASLYGEYSGLQSGFFVDNEDPEDPTVSINSYGNISVDASSTGKQISLNSPTISFVFANPTPNTGHWLVHNAFQQGTASHVLVYDSLNNEVKYVSIDSIGGSGSGDNIYTANGTLTGNRTLAGGDNSLTINGLSSFSARATGASVSQIFFDGSGTAIWEPFGTAYVGVSDQRVDIQGDVVNVTLGAGVGDRYAGFNSDGDLIVMSTPGGSTDTTSLSNRIDDAYYNIDSIASNVVRFSKPNGQYVDLLVANGGTDLPDDIVYEDTVQTLTNKRWTARIGTTTSSATPTINTDNYDVYKITAQAVDITSFTTNLSGTPTDGQILEIQITGTAARAITWGSSFAASTIALPSTTVTTATLTAVFQYYTTSSYGNNKWIIVNSF